MTCSTHLGIAWLEIREHYYNDPLWSTDDKYRVFVGSKDLGFCKDILSAKIMVRDYMKEFSIRLTKALDTDET